MNKKLAPFLVLLATLSCGTTKQNTVADVKSAINPTEKVDPTVYAQTITSAELKEMLYIYASDEFEGRETGEPGQKKAVNYLRQHYIDMGIASPLSGDDYFQEVPLEKQKSPEISITLDGKVYKNSEDFVSMGNVTTSTLSIDDIVYAGYGIETENYSDYKTIDVKDKVVLIKAGEPKNADGTYITSGTSSPTKWSNGRQAMASKRDIAKNKGAKALILMDGDSFVRYAAYYAAAEKSGHSGRLSLKSNTPEMIQLIANDQFGKALYDQITKNDIPKTLHKSLTIAIKSHSEDLYSENVVAFIKGSEKPDEIIVISAHLDHEGIKDGQIYNGADDDGSGTVAILEIAEAFKQAVTDGHGPKRSILFLHVTGEEKGLLGSKYYTDVDPIFPLANTVADLNIDMIGRIDPKHTNKQNYIYLIGSDKLSTELHNISEEANKKYTQIKLDYTYNDENDPNRFYYRSDHYNFAKNNVPIIFYFNGTHADYHKPTDTPDKIEYDFYETRTRLVFYTAWELANRDQRIVVDKAKTDIN
ncbi:M28 family metallopeptidase [Flavobacteriaceae bacterium LMO-SS05]